MSDVNTVVLSGRVVANPELKYTAKGTAVTSMRFASSHYYRSPSAPEGEFKEESLFITVEIFGKLAERVAERQKKGDPVMVRGRLSLNEWTAKDGTKKQTYRIFADQVNALGPRRSGADSADAEIAAEEGATVPQPRSGGTGAARANATTRPAHVRSQNSSTAVAATGTHGATPLARAAAQAPVEDLPF
jgi:single-strand DNA-binding protein